MAEILHRVIDHTLTTKGHFPASLLNHHQVVSFDLVGLKALSSDLANRSDNDLRVALHRLREKKGSRETWKTIRETLMEQHEKTRHAPLQLQEARETVARAPVVPAAARALVVPESELHSWVVEYWDACLGGKRSLKIGKRFLNLSTGELSTKNPLRTFVKATQPEAPTLAYNSSLKFLNALRFILSREQGVQKELYVSMRRRIAPVM